MIKQRQHIIIIFLILKLKCQTERSINLPTIQLVYGKYRIILPLSTATTSYGTVTTANCSRSTLNTRRCTYRGIGMARPWCITAKASLKITSMTRAMSFRLLRLAKSFLPTLLPAKGTCNSGCDSFFNHF